MTQKLHTGSSAHLPSPLQIRNSYPEAYTYSELHHTAFKSCPAQFSYVPIKPRLHKHSRKNCHLSNFTNNIKPPPLLKKKSQLNCFYSYLNAISSQESIDYLVEKICLIRKFLSKVQEQTHETELGIEDTTDALF